MTAPLLPAESGGKPKIVIPDLSPHEGSWVASRTTGEVIGEFFDRQTLQRFNPETVVIETIGSYLARVNSAIRKNINPER